MSQNPSIQVASILKEFDERADAFHYFEVSSRINPIVAQVSESGQPLAMDLIAERVVFELVPGSWKRPWRNSPPMELPARVSIGSQRPPTPTQVEHLRGQPFIVHRWVKISNPFRQADPNQVRNKLTVPLTVYGCILKDGDSART